jgi:Tol biopolymer transport system component
VDANRGVAAGPLKQLTDDHGVDGVPSITPDGSTLLYVSDKTGIRDIWMRNPGSGVEQAATSFHPIGYRPAMSHNGTRVVYPTTVQGKCAVLITELGDQPKTSALHGCFNVWDWSSDGSGILVYDDGENVRTVDLLKPASGERETLLSQSSVRFFDAGFSRDDRWITFTAGLTAKNSQVYVAPLKKGRIPESDWIEVTREGGGFAAWSPDGGMVYFHSTRDGFPCVWAQKLDANKKPSGPAFAVQHFHNISLGTYLMRPNEFRITVSKDRLVLSLVKQAANLWVTTAKK